MSNAGARGLHAVPAVGTVDAVRVDKWNVWDQPAAASDDIRFVDRELAEPADLSASESCQRSGLQPQNPNFCCVQRRVR